MLKRICTLLFLLFALITFDSCGKPAENSVREDNRITVDNVEGQSIVAAQQKLSACGVKNIKSNTDDFPGWSPDGIIVVSQNIPGGEKILPDETIVLFCKKQCRLSLSAESEDNWLFNTYDIDLYIDDQKITTIQDGKTISSTLNVLEGEHTLFAYKATDNTKKASFPLSIDHDLTFSCYITHSGEIKFEKAETSVSYGQNEIEMPMLSGMSLDTAIEYLSELGFTSIHQEPSEDNEGNSQWIVSSQNIKEGQYVDGSTEIILYCMDLYENLNNILFGKNVVEITKYMDDNKLQTHFYDESGNNLDTLIAEKVGSEKSLWIAINTSKSKDKESVDITLTYTGKKELTEEQQAELIDSSTDSDQTIFYSTNGESSVNNGKEGKYAYIKKNPSYDCYCIIDFDEGFVDNFTVGNGNGLCQRCKIASGDLNNTVLCKCKDGDDTWTETACFTQKNQPLELTYSIEGMNFEFTATDLKAALQLRNNRKIYDISAPIQ